MFNDRLRSTRMGMSLRHYQKYESGEIEPDLNRLVLLADFFNVPIDFLLCRDYYLSSLGVSVDVSLNSPPRRPKSQKSQ